MFSANNEIDVIEGAQYSIIHFLQNRISSINKREVYPS